VWMVGRHANSIRPWCEQLRTVRSVATTAPSPARRRGLPASVSSS